MRRPPRARWEFLCLMGSVALLGAACSGSSNGEASGAEGSASGEAAAPERPPVAPPSTSEPAADDSPPPGAPPEAKLVRSLPDAAQHPFNHGGMITDAVFTPDGKQIITASRDLRVRAWDVATGKLVWARAESDWSTEAVDLSPDGKRVATGDRSHLFVLDAATGDLKGRYEGTLWDHLEDVAFSPDGKHLAVGINAIMMTRDNRLGVWNVAKGQELAHLTTQTGDIRKIPRNERDRSRVVSTGWLDAGRVSALFEDGMVRVFERASGKLVFEHYAHDGSRNGALVPWQAGVLTTGRDPALAHVIGAEKAKPIIEEGSAFGVALFPDKKRALVGRNERAVVVDLATGKEILVVESRADGHPVADSVKAVAVSPDGQTAAFGDGNRLRLFDPATGQPKGPQWVGHPSPILHLAWTADGKHIVSAEERAVYAWPAAGGAPVRQWSTGRERLKTVTIGPAGGPEAVFDTGSEPLDLLQAEPGVLKRPSKEAVDADLVASQTGKALVALSWEGEGVVNTSKGTRPVKLEGLEDSIRCVGVSADGARVLVSSRRGVPHVFEGDKPGRPLKEPIKRVCALTPDGERLVALFSADSRMDERLAVWSVKTGDRLHTLGEAPYPIASIAVSPDGRHAVVGYKRETGYRRQRGAPWAVIYDLESGKALAQMRDVPLRGVNAVAFSPDGKEVAIAGDDMRVHVYGR